MKGGAWLARSYKRDGKTVLEVHPKGGWLKVKIGAVAALAPRLVGMDVNGEISAYTYRSRWKRWLSAADGQAPVPPAQLAQWQDAQAALNRRLLAALGA